jgi:hypothetical protein
MAMLLSVCNTIQPLPVTSRASQQNVSAGCGRTRGAQMVAVSTAPNALNETLPQLHVRHPAAATAWTTGGTPAGGTKPAIGPGCSTAAAGVSAASPGNRLVEGLDPLLNKKG